MENLLKKISRELKQEEKIKYRKYVKDKLRRLRSQGVDIGIKLTASTYDLANMLYQLVPEEIRRYDIIEKTGKYLPGLGFPTFSKVKDDETVSYKISKVVSGNIINTSNLTNVINIINNSLTNLEEKYKEDGKKLYRIVIHGKPKFKGFMDITRNIGTTYMKSVKNLSESIKTKLTEVVREYDDSDIYIHNIEFEVLIPKSDSKKTKGYYRSIKQANKVWYIINDKTMTNCFWTAAATANNWTKNHSLLKDSKKRLKAGENLKCRVNPDNKTYSEDQEYQDAADYLGINIKIYNNIYELDDTFICNKVISEATKRSRKCKGITEKTIELQRANGHMSALIRWNDIKEHDIDIKIDTVESIDNKINDNKIISSPKYIPFKKYNKYATYDIETYVENNIQKPYAIGLAWDDEYKSFWGMDCISSFFDYITQNINKLGGYTFYAHNGGKFDINILLGNGLFKRDDITILGNKCVELNNAWIGFGIMCNSKRIYFRDSFRMLPGSLDRLTNELNVEHKKKTGEVNHEEITKMILRGVCIEDIKSLVKDYLYNDCLGLLEVVRIFSDQVAETFQINLKQCYTGASLAKKVFFKKYYKSSKSPIYTLSDDNDKFIRDGYFGGRVEAFELGEIPNDKIYYYDFTSLYPDVGRKRLPYDEPNKVDCSNWKTLPSNFFGFVKCKVYGNATLHAVMNNGRLCFPILNGTELTLFSEEIKMGLELGYKYEYIEALEFKAGTIMKGFFEDGFKNKAKSKETGNLAMAQAWKIIINSGYGMWGLRTKDRDGVLICNGDDELNYKKYLEEEKLMSINKMSDKYTILRVLKDLDVKECNVGVAAAITSYARMKLFNTIHDIKSVGEKVYYCDTDSIITSMDITKYTDIRKKYQWDFTGKELGSLKNEAVDLCKSKNIKLDYEPYFNKCIIGGCKMYYLGMSDNNIEINKLKGYKQIQSDKLNKESFNKLANGKYIVQKQTQFRCSKQDYLLENNPFQIKVVEIKKRFRINYTKGSVQNGIVSPLIV